MIIVHRDKLNAWNYPLKDRSSSLVVIVDRARWTLVVEYRLCFWHLLSPDRYNYNDKDIMRVIQP